MPICNTMLDHQARSSAQKLCNSGNEIRPANRATSSNSNAYGRNFPPGVVLSLFVLIASTFNASGFFLSREASPRCALTTCSICVIRDRKA